MRRLKHVLLAGLLGALPMVSQAGDPIMAFDMAFDADDPAMNSAIN